MSAGGDLTDVHPTEDDPVTAALSPSIGGPRGEHAGHHPFWTPVRVILALTAVCFALGFVQKTPCYRSQWQSTETRYSDQCYSDIPYLYVDRGFAELDWPFSSAISVRDRYPVMEYPVGIAYYAYATAYVTHWLSGSPDIAPRGGLSLGQLEADHDVQREQMLFTVVSGLGFAICALLAAWFLAGATPGRPWDAAIFAVSPLLLLDGMINWDLLAVVCVAGVLWAQARGRPVVTGVMLGLGTAAKLYPVFLLGPLVVIGVRERRYRELATSIATGVVTWALVNAPAFLGGRHQWNVFWTYNEKRQADLGSAWLVVQQMSNHVFATGTINTVSWLLFAVWCAGVAVLGFCADETPRMAQLGYLVVAGFLLVNKVYSPQYALWLLPLAVLARPRWRDQIIWQGGEIFYYASVWWYLGNYLEPGGGGDPGFYWLATGVRLAVELYLVVIVARDIWWPEYDVARRGHRPRRGFRAVSGRPAPAWPGGSG